MDGMCIICKEVTTNVAVYGDWACNKCGQCYEYNEGHMIMLDDSQIILLKLAMESKTESPDQLSIDDYDDYDWTDSNLMGG